MTPARPACHPVILSSCHRQNPAEIPEESMLSEALRVEQTRRVVDPLWAPAAGRPFALWVRTAAAGGQLSSKGTDGVEEHKSHNQKAKRFHAHRASDCHPRVGDPHGRGPAALSG